MEHELVSITEAAEERGMSVAELIEQIVQDGDAHRTPGRRICPRAAPGHTANAR